MSSSKDSSRLIEKLKKLLAMSQSTANENEAMVAARQLHAMLAKHNLTMGDLDEKEDMGEYGEPTRNQVWKRYIAQSIAHLYFCDMYVSPCGDRKAKFMFVGTESNRTFAFHIYNMVINTLQAEANRESSKAYGKRDASFIRSFLNGAQVRVSQRCKELIRDAKVGTLEDEEGNTLPMMLDQYDQNLEAAKNWMNENYNLKSNKGRKTTSNDPLGFHKGKEAGGRVQLSRGIHGKNSTKLLN